MFPFRPSPLLTTYSLTVTAKPFPMVNGYVPIATSSTAPMMDTVKNAVHPGNNQQPEQHSTSGQKSARFLIGIFLVFPPIP